MQDVVEKCKKDMDKRIESLDHQLSKVRTGKASAGLLDGLKVDYYGAPTALNQVASIATPDARTIVITPFEKKILSDIERAIHMADLGIQPTNDGNIIRIPIPPLNEERRKEIAKSIKKMGEDTKVAIRLVRQDLNAKVKKSEKAKELTEDLSKELLKGVQDETDKFIKVIDDKVAKKEKEILTL